MITQTILLALAVKVVSVDMNAKTLLTASDVFTSGCKGHIVKFGLPGFAILIECDVPCETIACLEQYSTFLYSNVIIIPINGCAGAVRKDDGKLGAASKALAKARGSGVPRVKAYSLKVLKVIYPEIVAPQILYNVGVYKGRNLNRI